MQKSLFLASFVVFLFSLSANAQQDRAYKPTVSFANDTRPTPPNYTENRFWAALPTQKDEADRTPNRKIKEMQATAEADVFYIYPTLYLGKNENETHWNAPVDDPKFCETVRNQALLNQASIFNGAAKVYAPFYRQGHIDVYYNANKADCAAALDLAYADVKAAFEYYLANYNNGRPIIIAAHSQGTTHAGHLLRDFFDEKPLQKQLVAAYVVGMAVPNDYFKSIKICENPTETGCYCAWRTFERGFMPDGFYPTGDQFKVTNPLSWRTDTTYVPRTESKGSVLYKFKKVMPQLTDAQVHKGVIWCTRPKFFGDFLMPKKMKNYHIGDYNLYYMNVRQNAIDRVNAFLKGTKK
jgi:Protein of unknown function (DUF3089)